MALVRLRRLLGHPEAVIVREETVALNRSVCWVDAWSFGHDVAAMERGEGTPRALLRAGQRALESYRGPFLPTDPEDKSIMVMRLKLRDQLARLVAALAEIHLIETSPFADLPRVQIIVLQSILSKKTGHRSPVINTSNDQ